jgi:hypothetical protein
MDIFVNMNQKLTSKNEYQALISNIGSIIEKGRREAYVKLSQTIIKTYWEIGKKLVEFDQKGEKRAEYGEKLLIKLSKDLKVNLGKGFSRSNLQYMRLFYTHYPNLPDASGKLTWSHITLNF